MQDKLNGKTIRALCTDIDGTLLDGRRELSRNTIETIRKLSSLMPVVLASSRMPSAMRHLQNELGILDHPLICYNGGYVLRYDNAGQTDVLYSAEIPFPICETILTLAKRTSVHVSLYRHDQLLFNSGLNDLKIYFIFVGVISILSLCSSLLTSF